MCKSALGTTSPQELTSGLTQCKRSDLACDVEQVGFFLPGSESQLLDSFQRLLGSKPTIKNCRIEIMTLLL